MISLSHELGAVCRFPIPWALVLLFFVAMHAPAAETNRVSARFELYGLAGLHVMTERTSVEETADRYAITADLTTRGAARLFVDLSGRSEVHGTLAGDNPSPSDYRADIRRNGVENRYGLDYPGGGAVVDVSPPRSVKWPSVVSGQIRGTIDQLTAFFIVERQLARRGTCALAIPVFNGAEFYYLRFTDARREALHADGYQNLTAPTWVCDVRRNEIVANPDGNRETYQQGQIWYARLGDRVEPVRMEFDTTFGTVKGYLAELHGRGVDLDLIRE